MNRSSFCGAAALGPWTARRALLLAFFLVGCVGRGDCISYWDMDGEGVDSCGGNDLTQSCEPDPINVYQGASSFSCSEGSSLSRSDADLSRGFPGKDGSSVAAFTAVCAVRPTAAGGAVQRILFKIAGTKGWQVSWTENNDLEGYVEGSSSWGFASISIYEEDVFQCVGIGYDDVLSSDRLTLWHRASGTTTSAHTNDADGAVTGNANGFFVAANHYGHQTLDGQIDHCAVFDRKLLESEFNSYCDNGLDGDGL